jgi:hypothetical protein
MGFMAIVRRPGRAPARAAPSDASRQAPVDRLSEKASTRAAGRSASACSAPEDAEDAEGVMADDAWSLAHGVSLAMRTNVRQLCLRRLSVSG